MFVETMSGHFIPIANISRFIRHDPEGRPDDDCTYKVHTKDEREYVLDSGPEALQFRSMVPASPGWSVVEYMGADSGGPEIILKRDIIGWVPYTKSGSVCAVTQEEGIEPSYAWVLAPKGRVTNGKDGTTFDTYDEWLSDMRPKKGKAIP
jgi:hypothetical protein